MSRLNANEMHVLYERHHEVSSLIKVHQNTPNSVKYEVLWQCQKNPVKHEVRIKQYLRPILDISERLRRYMSKREHFYHTAVFVKRRELTTSPCLYVAGGGGGGGEGAESGRG